MLIIFWWLEEIVAVKKFLHKDFTIKDLGETDYFFGIQIKYTDFGIATSQQKFIHDILLELNMVNATPCDTSLPIECKISSTDVTILPNPGKYKT